MGTSAYTRFVSLDLKNALRCSIPFGRFGWKLSPQLRFNCQDPQLCWHRSRERQARKGHLRAQRKGLENPCCGRSRQTCFYASWWKCCSSCCWPSFCFTKNTMYFFKETRQLLRHFCRHFFPPEKSK